MLSHFAFHKCIAPKEPPDGTKYAGYKLTKPVVSIYPANFICVLTALLYHAV